MCVIMAQRAMELLMTQLLLKQQTLRRMAGRFWCQKGVFELSLDVTLDSKVKFESTITQPDDKRIILQNGYNFKSYLDAFGDEERAFKKAYQALLNFADHEWFCRKFS